jgi:hypothetical protein
MSTIFSLNYDKSNETDEINIDDLYEKKLKMDLKKLELYNRVLQRVHLKIKTTSRQRIADQYCFYIVPEYIIGAPQYEQSTCIAYLIDKLQKNKFKINYIHPHMLFISWSHWIPLYVREEFKKKTGITIDEFGNKQVEPEPQHIQTDDSLDKKESDLKKNKKKFVSIDKYKPTGNFIYNMNLLHSIEKQI